jgi:hypothetical protein
MLSCRPQGRKSTVVNRVSLADCNLELFTVLTINPKTLLKVQPLRATEPLINQVLTINFQEVRMLFSQFEELIAIRRLGGLPRSLKGGYRYVMVYLPARHPAPELSPWTKNESGSWYPPFRKRFGAGKKSWHYISSPPWTVCRKSTPISGGGFV